MPGCPPLATFEVLPFSAPAMPTQILTHAQVALKIRRLAYQLIESNFYEEQIFIASIHGQGVAMARLLAEVLAPIAPFKVVPFQIAVDKRARTHQQVQLTGIEASALANGVVVLVDDVLNSGRTLAFATAPLLSQPLRRLQIVVLVERSHRQFPVQANFSGLALATTLEEHVNVVFDGEQTGVWLN